ncbi:hypothetical protein HA402_000281 [Bradysia odoriphaga]|nr:hypothetical protein HA402_000281 [Bradysia odoriphaga]
MSLVAYGNSDEDSDDYDSSDEKQAVKSSSSNSIAKEPVISADAEPSGIASTLALKLPSPKKQTNHSVIEEDDEFLHKKAVPTEPPPKPPVKRGTVQITIPALPKQDEPKLNKKEKFIGAQPNRPAGLLNLLPKPTFGSFSKKTTSISTDAHASTATAKSKQSNGFIPHSVAKAAATSKKTIQKPSTNDDGNSGSDSSDDDDYFSFHTETKLPEVSQQEINAMVAKKAADIKTATTTYLQSMERQNVDIEAESVENVSEQSRIDDEALAALCGAKRARRGDGPSVVIELTGDQVLPNRDEWLRNQLQSTTEYQPRGLVDEEPAAGTRKKHQITYLAHQAKANEQELQAMWAANRHTRRQTQNKYGF